MQTIKKNTSSKKPATENTVVVTKTKEPVLKTAFPAKLEKVNDLLSKSSLLSQ